MPGPRLNAAFYAALIFPILRATAAPRSDRRWKLPRPSGIRAFFPGWDIFISPHLTASEYAASGALERHERLRRPFSVLHVHEMGMLSPFVPRKSIPEAPSEQSPAKGFSFLRSTAL